MTNTISTNFKGVFICDQETIYRFYAGVSYGGSEQVQKIGVMEPFGSKYPVFVSGAMTNYQKGRVEGTVLQNTYTETRQIDRVGYRERELQKESFLLINIVDTAKPSLFKCRRSGRVVNIITINIIIQSPAYGHAIHICF